MKNKVSSQVTARKQAFDVLGARGQPDVTTSQPPNADSRDHSSMTLSPLCFLEETKVFVWFEGAPQQGAERTICVFARNRQMVRDEQHIAKNSHLIPGSQPFTCKTLPGESEREKQALCKHFSSSFQKTFKTLLTSHYRWLQGNLLGISNGRLSKRSLLPVLEDLPSHAAEQKTHVLHKTHTHTQYSDGQEPGVSTTPLGTQ